MKNQTKVITCRASETGQTTISRTKTVRNRQAGYLRRRVFIIASPPPGASYMGRATRAKRCFKAPHHAGVSL
jgi:hypothetical protein